MGSPLMHVKNYWASQYSTDLIINILAESCWWLLTVFTKFMAQLVAQLVDSGHLPFTVITPFVLHIDVQCESKKSPSVVFW